MWYLANPSALYLALLPLAVLAFFLLRRRREREDLLALSGPVAVLRRQSRRTRWYFRALFAASCLAIALFAAVVARPTELKSWVERWSEGIDIVLVVDISESMDATDFEPNRMVVAKRVLRDFIRRRTEDRIGLVIFGGEAVTKAPLTRDYDFLLAQVDDMQMGDLKQGTAIGMGLANAIGRLRYSDSKNRIIVLLTDGDSNVGSINPITAAHLARQENIRVYTIGIGKRNRVMVPIYAKDAYGRKRQLIAQVPSYLNPELLREISRLTGGQAYMARDPGMLTRILREIDSLEKTKVRSTPRRMREDRYFYLALAGTLLMLLVLVLRETRFRIGRVRHATSP